MDPITHGITGALLGDAYFSEREGRMATFAAVLGAVFPDIDVIQEALSRDPLAIIKYHRGITHSFVGLPGFAALLAWFTRWLARRLGYAAPSWPILFIIYGIGIASHILLDGMTSFGTRMWDPISQKRVAWDLLFIVDFSFTSIVLLPQVVAWIYATDPVPDRERSRKLALRMWILFSAASLFVWMVAQAAGYPFHLWIVGLAGGLIGALFFLPAIRGWGFGVKRAVWCRAGTVAMVAYITVCAVAHHAAINRAQHFAVVNHIPVERMAALPVPPSFLDWGDAIRATDGVFQSRFDLRNAASPAFEFVPDSPPNPFTAHALSLPEVQLYLQFARFPTIRSSLEDGLHLVDFSEHRFTNGGRRGRQPFSYRVVFDSSGTVVAEGWMPNGMFQYRMTPEQPNISGSTGHAP